MLAVKQNFNADVYFNSNNQSEILNNLSASQVLPAIQEVVKKIFDSEMKNFSTENKNKFKEAEIIKGSEISFCRCNSTHNRNYTRHEVKFSFDKNKDYCKTNGIKERDKSMGFFNFNLTLYQVESVKAIVKISYLSEINIEEQFQSCGLSKKLIDIYTKALKELRVDVDYLHVLSDYPFTANITSVRFSASLQPIV